MGCSRPQIGLWVTGLVVFLLAVVSVPVLDVYRRRIITKKVELVNGSELYSQWVDPDFPVYLKVYVFDLQNPDDVLQGHKPVVKERGPYVYREEAVKVNVVHNDNGTVTYRQVKTYYFNRSMSVGWDNDTLTTVNIPLMTFVEALRWEWGIVREMIFSILELVPKETLFKKLSVYDIVFGYEDTLLKVGTKLYPSRFTTDLAGVLAGRNGTDDGLYTIFTGESNIGWLGVVDKYNGQRHLDYWTSRTANMVNGTDGTLCPPFTADKSFVSQMFSTDICRSVYGVYHSTLTSAGGLTTLRYRAPRAELESVTDNPDNAGFCTPAGRCMGTGVLNISTCQIVDSFHIPAVASFPHFLLAESNYTDAIIGLHPDPEKHSTQSDIEPQTGLVVSVFKRLQINIYVQAIKDVPQTKSVPTMVYPVLWVDEGFTVDEQHASEIQHDLRLISIAHYLQYAVMGLGAAILLVLASFNFAKALRHHGNPCLVMVDEQEEKSDLLSQEVTDHGLHDDHTATNGGDQEVTNNSVHDNQGLPNGGHGNQAAGDGSSSLLVTPELHSVNNDHGNHGNITKDSNGHGNHGNSVKDSMEAEPGDTNTADSDHTRADQGAAHHTINNDHGNHGSITKDSNSHGNHGNKSNHTSTDQEGEGAAQQQGE